MHSNNLPTSVGISLSSLASIDLSSVSCPSVLRWTRGTWDRCDRIFSRVPWIVNTQVQDVGAEKDAITSLRAPTHFGRPNWDRVFPSIADRHPDTDVGVVSAPILPRRSQVLPLLVR